MPCARWYCPGGRSCRRWSPAAALGHRMRHRTPHSRLGRASDTRNWACCPERGQRRRVSGTECVIECHMPASGVHRIHATGPAVLEEAANDAFDAASGADRWPIPVSSAPSDPPYPQMGHQMRQTALVATRIRRGATDCVYLMHRSGAGKAIDHGTLCIRCIYGRQEARLRVAACSGRNDGAEPGRRHPRHCVRLKESARNRSFRGVERPLLRLEQVPRVTSPRGVHRRARAATQARRRSRARPLPTPRTRRAESASQAPRSRSGC
jgi:hypothetical protein